MPHSPDRRMSAPNPNYIPPKLGMTNPADYQGKKVPEREWIITDWIPNGTVTMLGGDGGMGKSLLAQQLLTAAATGKSWLELTTTACRGIGIFCEDDEEEIWRRQERINQHYGVEFRDLENLKWKSLVGADAGLIEFDFDRGEMTDLTRQILATAVDFGAKLLVLDSLHDHFFGNENNRIHARQFINMLRDLAMGFDGAVVLTAHPSLSGLATGSGFSGSTAWNNAVRSRLYLKKPKDEDEDDNARILEDMKHNYSGQKPPLKLRWTEGVLVAEHPPQGVFAGMEARKAEVVFLEILDAVTAEGRHVSESSHSGNYAPKLFAKRPDRQGFTKPDFAKAMERLFADGKIRVEEYGREHDRRRRIVAVAEASEPDDSLPDDIPF